MKVITWETLYYEDHGATLKHKCGKRIVTLSLLCFSLIFLFGPFLFFMASFFIWASLASFIFLWSPKTHPNLWGNHCFHHPFLTWDNALMMMNITLLLLTTQYLEQNMTLCRCLWRCTRICNESRATCMKELSRWLCHKYNVNYMIMQKAIWQWWCVS